MYNDTIIIKKSPRKSSYHLLLHDDHVTGVKSDQSPQTLIKSQLNSPTFHYHHMIPYCQKDKVNALMQCGIRYVVSARCQHELEGAPHASLEEIDVGPSHTH